MQFKISQRQNSHQSQFKLNLGLIPNSFYNYEKIFSGMRNETYVSMSNVVNHFVLPLALQLRIAVIEVNNKGELNERERSVQAAISGKVG